MRKQAKKLQLHKVTIRTLTNAERAAIIGGLVLPTSHATCETLTCVEAGCP